MQRIQLTPRPDWVSQAESYGFHFHTLEGEPYWDETAAYQFSLREIEEDIERPPKYCTLCVWSWWRRWWPVSA